MHYMGNDGTKADDHEDNKLPCHNGHSYSLSSYYAACLKEGLQPEDKDCDEAGFYGSRLVSFTPSNHVLKVLHPPRFA